MLNTPTKLQSVGTANKWMRNIDMNKTYGSSITGESEMHQEILSLPTRNAEREINNDSPMQFKCNNKGRVQTDASDSSLLQLELNK